MESVQLAIDNVPMSAYDDLLKNFTSYVEQHIPPITQQLIDDLEIPQTEENIGIIGEAFARVFMHGVTAGNAEAVAQAVEQGIDVRVNQLTSPEFDEGRD